ncbi:MAG: aldo/keto reductase [Parasphingopyxis sp.]|nr:aldo/keto reductase family protein [Sphingomonadales bacterium]
MKYRQLGSSDLNVSEISLGTWLTTGVGIEKQTAIDIVDKAFDLEINFFDTANVYGRGASETVLGEALRPHPRDSYILATKLWGDMGGGNQGLSREQIEKQLDDSLARLQTDHVDLYQCHRYDPDTPLEETMAALTAAVKSGKVRYLGFSEWSPRNIRDALDLVPEVEKFVSSQPQYSILWRRPEKEVIPLSAANGISQIVWSPLAQGVLTGKYDADAPPPPDSRAANDEMNSFIDGWLRPEVIRAVDRMKPLADEAGVSLTQFALAWVLRQPNVASAIVGASRPDQLEENAGASGLEIDPALFEKAEEIAAGIPRPERS